MSTSFNNNAAVNADLAAGQADHTGIYSVIDSVWQRIMPVFPLQDFVAVNPFSGYSEQTFLQATGLLGAISNHQTLLPVDHFAAQLQDGSLQKQHLNTAIDEMVADGVEGAENIDVNQILAWLNHPEQSADHQEPVASYAQQRILFMISESVDRNTGSDWAATIVNEITKHCGTHYDEGQAAWASPYQDLPLYQAWKSAASIDRSIEIIGLSNFRNFVKQLPATPEAAIDALLGELGVPAPLWDDYLLCVALTIPGWASWTKYRHRQDTHQGLDNNDFAALLAMRLAYETVLSKKLKWQTHWPSLANRVEEAKAAYPSNLQNLICLTLQRAAEIAYRNQLLQSMDKQSHGHQTTRKLAQMVFCIDTRSERYRRHLESCNNEIATYGFAGFFGVPMEYEMLGVEQGSVNVPALIQPSFKVKEGSDDLSAEQSVTKRRLNWQGLCQAWKNFQCSAIGMFGYVESLGLLYMPKLAKKTLARFRQDAYAATDPMGPTFRGLGPQGINKSDQINLAESILRGIGIVDSFARLIVLCGHGCQTDNNPLQAGLQCGACGGHAGDSNARFAANLLNQPMIREELAKRGIEIPSDTVFVGALHNTTTDEVHLFDTEQLPSSHRVDLEDLQEMIAPASAKTRRERMANLPGNDAQDLFRRSADWSEVRPEWGLAGNAAFVVGSRDLTKRANLSGRTFLHSYDQTKDPQSAVLEQIMTAPLVVAHWINLQYYASVVNPVYNSSGTKTLHNVVGRFGILSGNGGDLQTGLPFQSLHDGNQLQHQPLRLLGVIDAAPDAVLSIIKQHESLKDLVQNGWLNLVVLHDETFKRLTGKLQWETLEPAIQETSLA